MSMSHAGKRCRIAEQHSTHEQKSHLAGLQCKAECIGNLKSDFTSPEAQKHTALKRAMLKTLCWNARIDTEAGMHSGISRVHNMRSSLCRFTEFCNSQCLSHFAAPFIADRTETSIAESCDLHRAITFLKAFSRRVASWWQQTPPPTLGTGIRYP